MRLEQADLDEPLPDPWEALANTVRDELEHRTGQREQAKVKRLTLRKWADRVPEPRGPLDFDRFVWQRELYDQHAADDREMVAMKATQVGMCLDPDTRVLTDALRWVPIGAIEEGDHLVAVDEEPLEPLAPGGRRRGRKMRTAMVTNIWRRHRPTLRLVFEDGTEVIASPEHRWLWRNPHRGALWRETGRLRPGDCIRRVAKPWPTEPSYEDGWLAGIIDGEGFLRMREEGGGDLVISQQFGGVYDRAALALAACGVRVWRTESPRPNGKPVGRLVVNRYCDLFTVLGRTQPTRMPMWWWEGRKLPGDGSSWARIAAVEPAGNRDVVDIETSTGTFLAEGLVSHNSTQAIRWLLFHADAHQRVCLYTFPTDRELGAFSRQRIRPVIRASEYLRSRMPADAIDNVEQKQIGMQGWAYFRGTNKVIDSVNADVVVFDEYDTSDQANIEGSERRVTGPDSAGLIRRVGVPSIPGFGISALYDASDQRVWTVRCAKGHWNPIKGYEAFSQNVDQDRMVLVCSTCQQPLDVRHGEWVAEFPDRDVRGYHIPKLIVPGVKLGVLVANSRKSRPDQVTAFHTRDLGEPYAPAEGRLSIEAVQACVRPELRPQDSLVSYALTTMGVDMASARALNVVIEEEVDRKTTTGRKVFIGTVEDDSERTAFQKLCWLMEVFQVNMAGIDNEPDGRFSQAFAKRHPGRVYRMDFFSPQPGARTDPAVWNVDDAEQFCSMWRTKVYDATFERFRLQRVLLPPLDLLPEDYPRHLGNLYRRRVDDPDGVKRPRIDYVRTGPEDYAQAEAYNLTAIELYWRNAGAALRDQGPQPMADEIEDYTALDLTTLGNDATPYTGGM